jgi:hypothetical protein
MAQKRSPSEAEISVTSLEGGFCFSQVVELSDFCLKPLIPDIVVTVALYFYTHVCSVTIIKRSHKVSEHQIWCVHSSDTDISKVI